MKERTQTLLGFVFLLLTTVVFFYPTVLYGRLPVPADSLVGLYHPFRDYYASDYPRGVPYKNFLITDPVRQQIPWRKAAVDQWKQGTVPWWNPYSFVGAPLLANIQAGAIYPLNIVFFTLDFATAWTVMIIAQTILSGVFLFLYLRYHRLHLAASLIGSLAWSYSGFHIAWLTWGTLVHAALWLPLALLSIDVLISERSAFKWYALLVASLSLSLLAGHAQIAIYVVTVTCIYAVWRLRKVKFEVTPPRIIVAIAIVVSIIAIQWVPYLEAISKSARVFAHSMFKTEGWFLPWKHLVQFISPDFFGNPSTLNYWGVWNYGEFVGYIGMVPLIFALSSLLSPSVDVILWTALAGLGFAFMLPSPLSRLPYELNVPLVSSLQPTRLMVVVDIALSVLAAYGVNAWITGKTRNIKISIISVGLTLAVLWLWILANPGSLQDPSALQNLSVSKRNLILPSFLWVASAGLFTGVGVLRKVRLAKFVLLAGAVLIVFADLARFGWKYTPFTQSQFFFPRTETISFLLAQNVPFRIMTMDDRILPPNVSGFYGIESIDGYDPLYLREYGDFVAAFEGGSPASGEVDFRRIITMRNIDSPLFPLLNVRYVLALTDIESPFLEKVFEEGETRTYENKRVLPRAFLVDNAVIGDTSKSVTGLHIPIPQPLSAGDEYARILSYAPSGLRVEVSADAARMLVLLNQFYRGWRATVDGRDTEVMRVYGIFQGVLIPPGKHVVKLLYRRF
jgi:hypothetical protein